MGPTGADPTRPDCRRPNPTRADPTGPNPTRPTTEPDPTLPDPTRWDPTRPAAWPKPHPTRPGPTRLDLNPNEPVASPHPLHIVGFFLMGARRAHKTARARANTGLQPQVDVFAPAPQTPALEHRVRERAALSTRAEPLRSRAEPTHSPPHPRFLRSRIRRRKAQPDATEASCQGGRLTGTVAPLSRP